MRVWWFALVLGVLVIVVAPTAALADDGGSGFGFGFGGLYFRTPAYGYSAGADPRMLEAKHADSIDHYDVLSATSIADNPTATALATLAGLFFTITVMCAGLSVFLVDRFALHFVFADWLTDAAGGLAWTYQHEIVERFQLQWLALTACVMWFGLRALSGRVGKGFGEILLSFVIVGASAWVLTQPATTLLGNGDGRGGLLGTARELGMLVASSSLGHGQPVQRLTRPDANEPGGATPDEAASADPTDVGLASFRESMGTTFVRVPHQLINFGTVLDTPQSRDGARNPAHTDRCLRAYNFLVDWGPMDGSPRWEEYDHVSPNLRETIKYDVGKVADRIPGVDGPARPEKDSIPLRLKLLGLSFRSECGDRLADYADTVGWQRLVCAVAIAVAVAAVIALLFVVLAVLVPIAGAQFSLALLAGVAPLVFVFALVGGGSRRILWSWLGSVLTAGAAVIVAYLALTFFLITLRGLLAHGDDNLLIRFITVDVVGFALLGMRRHLAAAVRSLGQSVEGRLGLLGSGTGGRAQGDFALRVRTDLGAQMKAVGAAGRAAGRSMRAHPEGWTAAGGALAGGPIGWTVAGLAGASWTRRGAVAGIERVREARYRKEWGIGAPGWLRQRWYDLRDPLMVRRTTHSRRLAAWDIDQRARSLAHLHGHAGVWDTARGPDGKVRRDRYGRPEYRIPWRGLPYTYRSQAITARRERFDPRGWSVAMRAFHPDYSDWRRGERSQP